MKNYIAVLLIFAMFTVSCKQKEENNPDASEQQSSVVSLENPTETQSHLPRLFSNGEALYMSWVTRKDKTNYLNYAVYDGTNWTKPETISQGDDWFINWADFPVISEANGNILTTYLQKSDTATYAYDIRYNIYNAATKTWKKDLLLNTDGTKTEHGFVSAVPRGDNFEVAWLDGRNTAGGHDNHGEEGAMTLRSAIITNQGEVINEVELDGRVCDCCQTASAKSIDSTLVAYRDRSDEEIRDIFVARNPRRGHPEASIRTVYNDNWKIAGCPVNGPSIDAFDTSFAVAWFTAPAGEGKVNVRFLENEAQKAIRVDNGNATGRVDIKMISKTEALVIWMEPMEEDEVLMLAKVTEDGKVSEIIVSKTSMARTSGFPQLEVLGNNAYIAWTHVGETYKSIKTATVPLADL
jgi:hypothetical protein